MSAKIYIARKDVIWPADHLYIIHDPNSDNDNDPSTYSNSDPVLILRPVPFDNIPCLNGQHRMG